MCAVVLTGLVLRLRLASITYLNPDEAGHALYSFGSLRQMVIYSFGVDNHPPLLLMMNHLISAVSRTELALRMVPVLSGSLFPLVLGAWLRRVAGKFAGMTALFLLTFAPHLVNLSAQVRSYTLAFLLLSASLVALEAAIDKGRRLPMVWFDVLLLTCIFADYSMAWFAGAVGIYALMRLRGSPRGVKIVWAAGQAAALILYAALFLAEVRQIPGSAEAEDIRTTWLSQAFPHHGAMLRFPWTNTLKQSEYLMASTTLGAFGSAMFAVAVFLLWTGRTPVLREKARALALLLTVPLVLGMAGAYTRVYPYGRSRHTLVMGLFIACGIAIFVESLPRRARIAMLCAPAVVVAVWLRFPDRVRWTWARSGTARARCRNASPICTPPFPPAH